MKKNIGILLIFLSISILFVGGCSKTLVSNKNTNMCDAVKEYLDQADFKGKGQSVHKGDSIVVDYIGRLADGTVFDTSIESVARGCDKYSESRNYSEGLSFEVGAGQMIAGFDRGVEGMKIGQTKTIEIAAKDAYGERDESLVYEVDKSDLQNPEKYEEGQTLYIPSTIEVNGMVYETTQPAKIYKVTKDKIYIDTNHELAGKTLIFDITVKEIK